MLRLIRESKEELDTVVGLCSSTYDGRVAHSPAKYLSSKQIIDENLEQISALLSSLQDICDAARVEPAVESGIYPSMSAEFTSIALPLPSAEVSILTPQAHYLLAEAPRSFSFDASVGIISGVAVYYASAGEASSRFVLSSEQQDYSEPGLYVDWASGLLTVGESVRCVTLDNNASARKSGLMQTLSGRPLAYRTISDVAYTLAAEPAVNNRVDSVFLQSGLLVGRPDLSGSIIHINDSSYVIEEGGSLCTFVSSTPSTDLDGTYQVNISSYEVAAVGQVIVLGEVRSNTQYSKVEMGVVSAKTGDYVLESGRIAGVVVEAGEGAVAEMSQVYTGGEVSIVAETYIRLRDFLDEAPLLDYAVLLPDLASRESFTYTAETCSEISTILSDLESLAEALSCPSSVSKVWGNITTLHVRAGLDRASDILSEARIEEYLDLGAEGGSYASMLSSIAEDLIVEVQK
jgi:hypothetical protein